MLLFTQNLAGGGGGTAYDRPSSDITVAGWQSTGASLYGVINETSANDSDYIWTPDSSECEIKLTGLSGTLGAGSNTLRVRAKDDGTGRTLTTTLIQGSGGVAVTPVRRVRTSQPQTAVGVNWANPLTRSIAYASVLASGVDSASNRLNTAIGTVKVAASVGFGSTFGVGTSDALITPLTHTSTQRTLLFIFNRNGPGGGTYGRLFDNSVEALYPDTTDNGLYFDQTWSGFAEWHIPLDTAGKTNTVVIAYDASSTSNIPVMYLNGVSQSVTTDVAPVGTVVSSTNAAYIGNRLSGGRNFDGRIWLAVVWDRVLSSSEIIEATRNPWQLFSDETLYVPRVTTKTIAGPYTDTLSNTITTYSHTPDLSTVTDATDLRVRLKVT